MNVIGILLEQSKFLRSKAVTYVGVIEIRNVIMFSLRFEYVCNVYVCWAV